MKLCAPRGKSHDSTVIVRVSADRCSLIGTGAANRVGAEHVVACHIEQIDRAGKPAIRVIPSERTHSGSVTRNGGSAAKPGSRLGKMDNPAIGCPIEHIDIETEAAHYEHAAIPGDWVVNGPSARPCDAEQRVARGRVDDGGTIILRDQGD